MADTLGNIAVPEIIATGIFPFISDYPHGRTEERLVAAHRFPMGDGKTEQRFFLGTVARVFSFRRQALCQADKDALVSFWETNQGAYGLFTYNTPNEDGTTTPFIVRFKDQTLTLDGVIGSIMTVGVEFVEVVSNATIDAGGALPLNGTDTRFPGTTLTPALLQPTQEIIPLYKITVRDSTYPVIYISDRRVTIGSQLYQARVLKRGPIEIGLNGETAPVEVTLGNADTVLTLLARDTDLRRADVEISFYHVATGIKLDFWKGYIVDYSLEENGEFSIQIAEGIYELTLGYPIKKVTKTCWRIFNSAKSGCPYATAGSGGDPTFCDKGFDTPKGCLSHTMAPYFGGVFVNTETVATKDNSTGLFGIGRNTLAITSQIADSIFGLPLPEVYCDFSADPNVTIGIPVSCLLVAGIDEGDFYDALGIVCAGPIGAYAEATNALSPFYLDGQPYFGWPLTSAGLRRSYGHSPAADNDPDPLSQWFFLTNSGDHDAIPAVPSQNLNGQPAHVHDNTQAGGVAFVEIRRIDAKGLQISTLASHSMQVSVRVGMGGYQWSAPGSRTFSNTGLASPVWIAINMLLKAVGLWGSPPTDTVAIADQEAVFDVQSAVDLVTLVTNITVPAIIGGTPSGGILITVSVDSGGSGYAVGDVLNVPGGDGTATITVASVDQSGVILSVEISAYGSGLTSGTGLSPSGGTGSGASISITATDITDGTETQFQFAGAITQEQTLKDWLIQVINTYLGYYSFAFGKLKLGAKYNSSVKSAFSVGNVILGSSVFAPISSTFNRLLVNFADKDYGFVNDAVDIYDITHAMLIGTPDNPKFLSSELNLVGVFSRSQAARIGITRLREELGGFTIAEFKYGSNVKFSTTLLAAEVEPGMVCSIEVNNAPNYPATYTGSADPNAPAWPANISDPQAAKNQYAEFRITKMVLNEDYSMDIVGVTTHNDIYAYDAGPKPADVLSTPIPVDDRFAPANWKFRAYTKKDGNLILGNFAVGTNGLSVHLGLFEIFYIDERTSFYAQHIQSLAADATVVPYAGTPPKEGSWFLIEKEIFKVVKVHPLPGFENIFSAVEVERGQFGTVAVAHNRVSTQIYEIDPKFPNRIRLDTGLNLHPGQKLYNATHSTYYDPNGSTQVSPSPADIDLTTATGGYWSPPLGAEMISEYDATTGWCVLARYFWEDKNQFHIAPLPTAIVGDTVYSDARIWNVQLLEHEIAFQPRFFSSITRSAFEETIPLPMAGVVTIRGKLENTRGLQSDVVALFPIGSDNMEPRALPYSPPWPYFIRTLGNHRFLGEATRVSGGNHTDIFGTLNPVESQSFEYALVTIPGGVTDPIDTPAAITSIVPTAAAPSGLLSFTGTPDIAIQIQIKVHSGNEILANPWLAKDNGISGASTLAQLVTSLANWLNDSVGNPVFSGFYTATVNADGVSISIQDRQGFGGTLDANYIGPIVIAISGFQSTLGILSGRKYAAVFVAGSNKSDSSALSRSSGPTGDFRAIQIQDVPDSTVNGADSVEIYATPDGQDSPLYLIGKVDIHTLGFLDQVPESNLSSKPIFNGPVQAAAADTVIVRLKKNGVPWADFRIPPDQNVSNTVHGFALDPVSQDAQINADIEGDLGGDVDVLLEMQ